MNTSYQPFFLERYRQKCGEVAQALKIDNPHRVPKLEKIIIHARFGKFLSENPKKRFVKEVLGKIAAQLPCDIKARKSVSQFKIRTGMTCGCMVTLRHQAMYEFLARLWIALPRMRNFNGFKRGSFDGQGNFNFGVEDHASFPEVENMIDYRFGFEVFMRIKSPGDQASLALLEALGMPFVK